MNTCIIYVKTNFLLCFYNFLFHNFPKRMNSFFYSASAVRCYLSLLKKIYTYIFHLFLISSTLQSTNKRTFFHFNHLPISFTYFLFYVLYLTVHFKHWLCEKVISKKKYRDLCKDKSSSNKNNKKKTYMELERKIERWSEWVRDGKNIQFKLVTFIGWIIEPLNLV